MGRSAISLLALACFLPLLSADAPAPKSAKEGLQPFNDLIGSWRCTGTPAGLREEQLTNFWTETLAVEWQFKGADAWLRLDFKKDKDSKKEPRFSKGELRYRVATNDYELKLLTTQQKALVYTGSLDDRKLTLERPDGSNIERLVVSLLHSNRFLYRLDTRPADKSLFAMVWKVGATKEGESFATGDGGPECIVSGGKGTIAVAYQGKTYYVCCSGCRGEFLESPQKYIAEYEAKKTKKTK
jgi:YHS domain-containing protein